MVDELELDPKGYFVISVDKEVLAQHFDYENVLLYTFSGKTALGLQLQILAKDAVSRLDHAMYLGRELMKAQIALGKNVKYVQDEKLII